MTLLDDIIDGASGNAPVATLLRQVKVLSARTGSVPLAAWVDQELDGYGADDDVPAYRGPYPHIPLGHFVGAFGSQVKNVQIPPSTFPENLRDGVLFKTVLDQPIAQIERYAQQDHVTFAWPSDAPRMYEYMAQRGEISRVVRDDMVLAEVHYYIEGGIFVSILDAVRTKVLDLALDLERVAPLAGQRDAPDEQRQPAAQVINQHFYGTSNLAVASPGAVQVGRDLSSSQDTHVTVHLPAVDDTDGLLRYLGASGVAPVALAELARAIDDDIADQQLFTLNDGSASLDPTAVVPGSSGGAGDTSTVSSTSVTTSSEAPVPGSGGRWRRTQSWLANAATDTASGSVGGVIGAAAAAFLGIG